MMAKVSIAKIVTLATLLMSVSMATDVAESNGNVIPIVQIQEDLELANILDVVPDVAEKKRKNS